MNTNMRNVLSYLLLGVVTIGASACATTRGVGEDVENLGEEIQEEADEHD